MFMDYLFRFVIGTLIFFAAWYLLGGVLSFVSAILLVLNHYLSDTWITIIAILSILAFIYFAYRSFVRGGMYVAAVYKFFALTILISSFGKMIPYGIYVIASNFLDIYMLALIVWGIMKLFRKED